MALYTILFGLSLFMIALVMAIIKNMFLSWKEEHKIERMEVHTGVDRPAVSVMITIEKCVFECRKYYDDVLIYTVMSKISLNDENKPKQSDENLKQN